jgi:hypothetical protein
MVAVPPAAATGLDYAFMMMLLPLLMAGVLLLFSRRSYLRVVATARPSCEAHIIKEVLELHRPHREHGTIYAHRWCGSSDKDMARVRVRIRSLGTCTDKPTTKQRREARHDVTWHLAVFLAFSVRVVASGDRYGGLSQRWTGGEALPVPWLRPARGCLDGCGDNRPGVSLRQGSAVSACNAKEEQDPCQVDRS